LLKGATDVVKENGEVWSAGRGGADARVCAGQIPFAVIIQPNSFYLFRENSQNISLFAPLKYLTSAGRAHCARIYPALVRIRGKWQVPHRIASWMTLALNYPGCQRFPMHHWI